jgi:hypothetical protein
MKRTFIVTVSVTTDFPINFSTDSVAMGLVVKRALHNYLEGDDDVTFEVVATTEVERNDVPTRND